MDGFDLTRRGLVMGALAVAAAGAMGQGAGQAPIPVQAFFEKSAISSVQMSPTGRHVAMVATNKDNRVQLVVLDTATLKPFVAAGSSTLDVRYPAWVNDKRLVYMLADPERKFSEYTAAAGLFAVDRDGSEPKDVVGMSRNMVQGYFPRLLSTTWNKDSDDLFIGYPQSDNLGDEDHILARRVNTRTGTWTAMSSPGRPRYWSFGPDDTPLFVVTREEEGKSAAHVWDATKRQWDRVVGWDPRLGESGPSVVGYLDSKTALAERRAAGSDVEELYQWDLVTRKFSPEPILSAKGFDADTRVIRSRGKVVGLQYRTDALATVWFDDAFKAAQAKVDALLPNTINVLGVPLRPEVPVVLVTSYSDVEPGRFALYDLDTQKLTPIGQSRPAIDPGRMARLEFVKYKARDGLDIPAWVTTPRDGKKGPRPTVVLVHGGPWVSGGHWGWNPMTQFLASRGHVVLEPNFRGTTGYGFKHFRASWKQWGLKMQDDVADGTRWAIEKGIADPKRICIAGASYGGYATLMGLINDPDLYKCGINWVGVTDINLMYSVAWSDFPEEYKRFGMPYMVGDRQKDAAQIDATSPVRQAARVKQPLLMAYGGNDRRVPITHGLEFRDAVLKTNQNVEWVDYPDEGHGWIQLKNNVDWWTRVEKFLAKNIGQ